MVQAWVPTGLASYGVLALLFARGESGVAQPVSSSDVYVLDISRRCRGGAAWVC
jgi:hypothetical protein